MIDVSIVQLRHFVALADNGSFTKAAERSLRSQAAFSRSIGALEAQLGAALVDRIGHRNELTPLGRIVLQHARNVIADVDHLTRTSQEYSKGSGGHFRLGLGSTPSALLSEPLLAYASHRRANMRITLTFGKSELQIEALRERQTDAVIVETRSILPTPDLAIEHIAELPTGLLCRPGHPLTRRKRIRFQDLLAYPVASTSMSDEAIRFLVESFGPDAHPDKFVSLQCDEIRSLLDVVQTSNAVFIGVVAAAAAFLRDGSLVLLEGPGPTLNSVFSIATLRGRGTPLSFPAIRNIVRETLRAGMVLPVPAKRRTL